VLEEASFYVVGPKNDGFQLKRYVELERFREQKWNRSGHILKNVASFELQNK
jgi:hypothetical protein